MTSHVLRVGVAYGVGRRGQSFINVRAELERSMCFDLKVPGVGGGVRGVVALTRDAGVPSMDGLEVVLALTGILDLGIVLIVQ